jgi:hypothetical protein
MMRETNLKKRQLLAMCVMSGLLIAGCNSAPQSPSAPTTPAKPEVPPAAAPAAAMPAPTPVAKASVAPPSTQPMNAVQGTVLHISPESAARILAGTQTSTARKGIRTLPVGPATLLAGSRQIPVEITHLTRVKFSDLSDADARTGGMASLVDLKESLAKYNPDLKDTDDMTVIHFRLKQ